MKTHIYVLIYCYVNTENMPNLHFIFISWIVGPTSQHVKSVTTVTKRIISSTLSNYSDNMICDMLRCCYR
jgi:hypothetical protein